MSSAGENIEMDLDFYSIGNYLELFDPFIKTISKAGAHPIVVKIETASDFI